jgi:hypothetical protein
LTETNAMPATATLAGLQSKRTFHFNAVASNAVGTANGAVLSSPTD